MFGAARAQEGEGWLIPLAALLVTVSSAAFAGMFVGAYWRSAGLLIGPSYWGAYLATLALAMLGSQRRLALGMVAALLLAVPLFVGLAVLSSFPATP